MIIKLQGGLGNQMFQYALGVALEERFGAEVFYDLDYLEDRSPREDFVFRDYDLDVFGIQVKRASKGMLRRIEGRPLSSLRYPLSRIARLFSPFHPYRERGVGFDANVFRCSENTYFDGHWQSWRYWEGVEPALRKAFTFREKIPSESMALLKRIESTQSVCLNVRRSDYISHKATASFLGFVGEDYYKCAMAHVCGKLENVRFFVFSDDIPWCEDFFRNYDDLEIVGHEHAGDKFSNYLQLMSQCRHFIIPNSTFAWWAAWLAEAEDSIKVAPRKWFADEFCHSNDIVPENWTRI